MTAGFTNAPCITIERRPVPGLMNELRRGLYSDNIVDSALISIVSAIMERDIIGSKVIVPRMMPFRSVPDIVQLLIVRTRDWIVPEPLMEGIFTGGMVNPCKTRPRIVKESIVKEMVPDVGVSDALSKVISGKIRKASDD